MNSSRTLTILLFVTLFAVAGATLVVLRDQAAISTDIETAPLFPELDQRLDAIVELRVEDAQGSVTVRRTGERWTLPDKHGYPADQARVRRAILGAAQIEIHEAKTSDPALYDRLGLRDPEETGSRSVRFTLLDGEGRTLASLVIGDRPRNGGVYAPGSGNGLSGRSYVRLPGEAQSWLASGVPDMTAAPADWVDDRLLSLPQERVKRVAVRPADGDMIRIFRDSPGADNFSVADLPEDRKVRTVRGPESLAAGLAFLSFDDVKPADSIDWSGSDEVVFTAFDGLQVTVRLKDGWANFAAAYDPAIAEEGEGGEVLPSSPPDGAAEARQLNERYGAWAYRLPDYKVEELTPTMDNLTESTKNEESASQKAP